LLLSNLSVPNGIWRLEPPKEIPPGLEADFGAESYGIGGTSGKISWTLKEVDQVNMPINFTWEVGLIGSPEYTSNVFSIEPVVIGNHTEVILHFSSDELYLVTSSLTQNEKPTYNFQDDDLDDIEAVSSSEEENKDNENQEESGNENQKGGGNENQEESGNENQIGGGNENQEGSVNENQEENSVDKDIIDDIIDYELKNSKEENSDSEGLIENEKKTN